MEYIFVNLLNLFVWILLDFCAMLFVNTNETVLTPYNTSRERFSKCNKETLQCNNSIIYCGMTDASSSFLCVGSSKWSTWYCVVSLCEAVCIAIMNNGYGIYSSTVYKFYINTVSVIGWFIHLHIQLLEITCRSCYYNCNCIHFFLVQH